MTDPQRAERLWLALSVSLLWALQTGTAQEEREAQHDIWVPLVRLSGTRLRLLGLFPRGLLGLRAALQGRRPLPKGYLAPEPWPDDPKPEKVTKNTYPC